MRVLDLFCGLKGWSEAFEKNGHEVITVDFLPKFKPTICADIFDLTALDFEKFGRFDVILASPPCNCFSVASLYRHWDNGRPKDQATIKAIELVRHTLDIIHDLNPSFWVLENPRGMLRKVIGMPNYQISQCQYGRSVMKPTDLWGVLPSSFIAKKCKPGSPCHEKASRSAKAGTQAINNSFSNLGSRGAELRAKIPYGLSEAVCLACEIELCEKKGGG
jgi:site-specific DNA-cytosine methylase